MRKIFIIFFIFSINLYGAMVENGNLANNATNLSNKDNIYFKNPNDTHIKGGSCSWECRETTQNYAAIIIGFDIFNGKTFCKVYERTNSSQLLSIDASKTNEACANELKNKMKDKANEYENNISNKANDKKISYNSKIAFNSNDTQITLSKFLSSLATLNPNIIDREATNNQGQLVLKDGIQQFSVVNINKDKNVNLGIVSFTPTGWLSEKIANLAVDIERKKDAKSLSTVQADITSASDGFNKSNMGYFSDLFLANEEIYQYLQFLIFTLVGGFFVTKIGAEKIQTYLENRGESDSKQPYLHKFYIPLIALGLFFMPIPEANNKAHSTIIQNVIRLFAAMSTDVADRASATINNTYMNKIYKSIGYVSPQSAGNLVEAKIKNEYVVEKIDQIYKKTCAQRFDKSYGITSYQYLATLTDEEKKKIFEREQSDLKNVTGTKADITLDACIAMEVQAVTARNEIEKSNQLLERIEKIYDDSELNKKISNLDSYFALRESQLGWVNALITPSSAILAETFTFNDDMAVESDMKKATKANAKNTQARINEGSLEYSINSSDEINDSALGWLAGKLVYMMLPGASEIKNFAKDNSGKIGSALGGLVGGTTTGGVGSFFGSIIGGIAGWLGGTIIGYTTAVVLMEWTLEKIPLLVCTTASIVAFISYLISLIKYFYISPFVVAYALTANKINKITEFLITGISIFLKPVLIVLFIGLALFVHTLIDEIFVFISIEQFTGIKTSLWNFHTNFVIGSITGLLLIFGKLASSYIIWKLVVSGPAWALSLVGVDGKQDDMISSGIEANLARRAFVV